MHVDLIAASLDDDTGRRLLDELADLNRGFLELIGARHRGRPSAPVFDLEPGVAARISGLDDAGCSNLARCPVALFDLRLSDAALWRGLAAGRLPDPPADGAPVPCAELHATTQLFTLGAMLHARHAAEVNPFLARITLGAADAELQAFQAVSLRRLRALAQHPARLLGSRQATDPRFWRDLLALADETDAPEIFAARVLGSQLPR